MLGFDQNRAVGFVENPPLSVAAVRLDLRGSRALGQVPNNGRSPLGTTGLEFLEWLQLKRSGIRGV